MADFYIGLRLIRAKEAPRQHLRGRAPHHHHHHLRVPKAPCFPTRSLLVTSHAFSDIKTRPMTKSTPLYHPPPFHIHHRKLTHSSQFANRNPGKVSRVAGGNFQSSPKGR